MKGFASAIKSIPGVVDSALDDWTPGTAESGSIFVEVKVTKWGTAGVSGRGMQSKAPWEFEVKPVVIANKIKKLATEKNVGIEGMTVPKKKYSISNYMGRRETRFDGYDESSIHLDVYAGGM
jgi:hypothetical protein